MIKRRAHNVFAVTLGLLMAAMFLLAGCGAKGSAGQTDNDNGLEGELNLFIWSEYMPNDVLARFEREYGVKVNRSEYSSNEEAMAKISAAGGVYDLAVLSDYMVDVMIKQKMLDPVDLDKIPNFKNIGEDYKNQPFDPGNRYSVPYMWGSTLIAVDQSKVKDAVTSYADLWRPEFRNSLVVLDDAREVIGMVLQKMGYAKNETDPSILEQAKEELQKLMPNIKAFDSDSPKTLLINGEAVAGFIWNGEIPLAQQGNPNIVPVFPQEGIGLWMDSFVIPQKAPHPKAAHAFINYVLDPKVSAEISKAFPYSNPNEAAHQYMDPALLNNPAVYPPKDVVKKGQYIRDIGEATKLYDRIWSEVKR
ncbi:MAG: spermidine/putrescine ABC transporter substrate-binding protein [Hydrogenibacillus sp.]|nr:spermidine/putrescine ABC transporter substrate-binding protein [Hydrogenibacillus sp.]